jgi:SAM-dependent methyltransferase
MWKRKLGSDPPSPPPAGAGSATASRGVPSPPRLHVGCGRMRLEGWLNLDIQDLPGVDLVVDVSGGLHFEEVEAVYAEHFLEHLDLDRAVAFLLDVHRCLRPGGVLRLSTPNLDWVWETHYSLASDDDLRRLQGLRLNRAFHGWRHRFLWNRPLLGDALAACGFRDLVWCRYGESGRDAFRGLERHETYEDRADLPHVLIVEAGKGPADPAALAEFNALLEREFLSFRTD